MSKKAKIIILSVFGVLFLVMVINLVILPLTGDFSRVYFTEYKGDNQYIAGVGKTMLSAHRAGGDLEPEETLAAFKNCMENYDVDIVEFDLHLTKDNHLVLMHDHEIDRTSDGEIVYKKGTKVEDLTLDQLKKLNFGYDFSIDGVYKYREEGADLSDVRILELDEILSYLENTARPDHGLNYVIEIKDGGKRGKTSMDILFETMEKFDITDRVIVGTFKGDITKYIDKTYKGKVRRSAGILEVLNFYFAFLYGVKQNPDKLGYDVLQIPMGLEHFYDFSTKAFIDYAHSLGIAVQYWTINDREDVKKLVLNGADTIMTDDPKMADEVLSELGARWEAAVA